MNDRNLKINRGVELMLRRGKKQTANQKVCFIKTISLFKKKIYIKIEFSVEG